MRHFFSTKTWCVSAVVFSRVPILSWLVTALLQTSLAKVVLSFFMQNTISRVDLCRVQTLHWIHEVLNSQKYRFNLVRCLASWWSFVPVLVVDRISMMLQSFMTTALWHYEWQTTTFRFSSKKLVLLRKDMTYSIK